MSKCRICNKKGKVLKTKIVLGDLTCCGDKNTDEKCRQEDHINYICDCYGDSGVVWSVKKK